MSWSNAFTRCGRVFLAFFIFLSGFAYLPQTATKVKAEFSSPVNYAAGKTAVASSVNTKYPERTANLATDDSYTTQWYSYYTPKSGTTDGKQMEDGATEWIYVDLGAERSIGRVVINWGDYYATQYTVKVSNDAASWNEVAAVTDGTGGTAESIFGAVNCRYVKIECTAMLNYAKGFCIAMIEVYAPQSAITVTAAMASSSVGSNVPENSFDNNNNTYWLSEDSENEWIAFDLGDAMPLYKTEMLWGAVYAADYEIQVSVNNRDWSRVYLATAHTVKNETISFAPVMARYVKINATKRAGSDTQPGYWLREIRFYADTTERAERAANSIQSLKDRLKDGIAGERTDLDNVAGYMNSMDEEGKWADIDYASTSTSNWPPLNHIDRLLAMSAVYAHETTHELYKSPELFGAIKKSIDFWFSKSRPNDNWWNTQMAPQQKFRVVALYMEPYLDEVRMKKMTGILQNAIDPASTGANTTWWAENVFFKGLLRGDLATMYAAIHPISDSITLIDFDENSEVPKEGLQPDYSFTQHGRQLYSGGYGSSYLKDSGEWAYYLKGTEFAIDQAKVDSLIDMMLEGNRWMMRYEHLDASIRGREITRKNYNGALAYLAVIQKFMTLTDDEGKIQELQKIADHINGLRDNPGVTGNRYFYRTDYMTHIRDKYYTSLRMLSGGSSGILGGESTLGENSKGGFLAYGLTWFMRTGDEYETIFPAWDWKFLPGVSSPEVTIDPYYGNFMNKTFVGAVSDGTYGAAGMDLYKTYTPGNWSFGGRKAYFFFDDEMVAVGTDLSSTYEEAPMNTTLNQCLLDGDVYVDNTTAPIPKSDTAVTMSGNWVYHDRIGYVFPNTQEFKVQNGSKTGYWADITPSYPEDTDPVTADIFTLYVTHGLKPTNGSYEYIVVNGKTKEEIAQYSSNNPISILTNTKEVQAVRHKNLGITGMIFYQAGNVSLGEGTTVTVDKPCMVLLKEKGGAYDVSVSNPDQPGLSVNVTVKTLDANGEENFEGVERFDLPSGAAFLGKTVTKSMHNELDIHIAPTVSCTDADDNTLSTLVGAANAKITMEIHRNDENYRTITVWTAIGLYDDQNKLMDVKTASYNMSNDDPVYPPSISINEDTGKVKITGNTGLLDEVNRRVSIVIKDKETGNSVFVKQTKADSDGNYTFMVSLDNNKSYTVYIGGYWTDTNFELEYPLSGSENDTQAKASNTVFARANFDLTRYSGVNDNWHIKTFIWDSFDNMKPYVVPAKLPISSGIINPDNPNIRYIGRWDDGTDVKKGYWGGTYFKVGFTGTTARLKLDQSASVYVSIDGGADTLYENKTGTVDLTPIPLSPGNHTLRVATRYQNVTLAFAGLQLDRGAYTFAPNTSPNIIEFIGDSITAGYKLGDNATIAKSDAILDYAWLAGEMLGAEHTQIAYSGIRLTDGHVDANISPNGTGMFTQFFRLNTSLLAPDDESAVNWDFGKYQPKIVVINLGTNDKGDDKSIFQERYVDFLQRIRQKYPNATILALETFGGYLVTETQNAVNSADDPKIHYVDTTGWVDNTTDADGDGKKDAYMNEANQLHPKKEIHPSIAAKLVEYITNNHLLAN